jgi:hypothetical protein
MPLHALLEGGNFRHGSARDSGESDVAGIEVELHAVEGISQERTTGATLYPARAEHKVIDNELGFIAEQIGQSDFSMGTIEDVILFDSYPRKFAALGAERIAPMSEIFFFGEEIFASGQPFGSRDYRVLRGTDGLHFSLHVLFPFC